jgi:hypothetical protein
MEPVDDLGGVREVLGGQLPDPLGSVTEHGHAPGRLQAAAMGLQRQP